MMHETICGAFDLDLDNLVIDAGFDMFVVVEVLDCNLLDSDIDTEVYLALYIQLGTEFL